MKYITILTLFLLSFSTITHAQSGVSFELHYPIVMPAETNYVTETTGILGGGVQFQFTDDPIFNYGIKYKFDQISSRTIYNGVDTSQSLSFMIHHIDAVGLYNLNDTETIKAVLESGITFYKYRSSSTTPAYFGFHVNPGLQFVFQKKFYALLNYSFIKTSLKQKQTGFEDRESFQVIRLGIGFNI